MYFFHYYAKSRIVYEIIQEILILSPIYIIMQLMDVVGKGENYG